MKTLTEKAQDRLACIVRHRAVDTTILRGLVAPDVSSAGFRMALYRLREKGLVDSFPRLRGVHRPDRQRWHGDLWYATGRGVEVAEAAGLAPARRWRWDPESSTVLTEHLDMANEVMLRLVEAARSRDGVEMDWTCGEHEVGFSYGSRSSEMVVVDLLAHFAGPDGGVRWLAVEVDRGTHDLTAVARKIQLLHRTYEAGHWRDRIPPGADGHVFPRVLFVFETQARLEKVAARVANYPESEFEVDASTLDALAEGDPFGDVWTPLT